MVSDKSMKIAREWWGTHVECVEHWIKYDLTRVESLAQLIDGLTQWQDIATAAEDPNLLIEVYAPEREGLPPMVSLCRWHPDAGFCVCEIRNVTCWRRFSPPGETLT